MMEGNKRWVDGPFSTRTVTPAAVSSSPLSRTPSV